MQPLLGVLRLGFLLVLVLALSAATTRAAPPAQPPEVTATVDVDQVTVGDRITLTVAVRHAADVRVELPQTVTGLGDLEVVEALPLEEAVAADGSGEIRLTYAVAAFRTGDLNLAFPPIAYVSGDGTRGEAVAPVIPIRVESVLPAGQPPVDIQDLKPQLSVPGDGVAFTRPLLAALVATAVALGMGRLALYWHQRPRLKPPLPPPPSPAASPEEVARADLERIAALDLIARDDYKGFYSGVAACIRRYLTEQYGFPAVAMTTAELEAQMVGWGLDRWQARLVSGLLSECDAVVYARYVPAAARAEGTLDMAYEVVAMASPAGQEALAEGVER
ncbi:MAG: hypothetical protein ACE5IZ_03980 [Dehalococcoidia bacterium]